MKILKLLIKILSFFNCPKMTYNMSSGTLIVTYRTVIIHNMALLANEQWNSQLQNPELGKDNKLLSIFVKKIKLYLHIVDALSATDIGWSQFTA